MYQWVLCCMHEVSMATELSAFAVGSIWATSISHPGANILGLHCTSHGSLHVGEGRHFV